MRTALGMGGARVDVAAQQYVLHRLVHVVWHGSSVCREMYDRFRDWYLTQGEYTHKKKMLLKDVRRKIAETDNRKQYVLTNNVTAALSAWV